MALELKKTTEQAEANPPEKADQQAQGGTPPEQSTSAPGLAAAPPPPPPAEDADAAGGDNADDVVEPLAYQKAGNKFTRGAGHYLSYLLHHPKLTLGVLGFVILAVMGYFIGLNLYHQQFYHLASEDFSAGRYGAAVNKLQTYIQLAPEDADSATLLSRSYVYLKNYDSAIAALDGFERRTAGVEVLDHYLTRAVIAVLTEDTEGAELNVERVFIRDAGNIPGNYLQAAIYYYTENNMRSALSALDEALRRVNNATTDKLESEAANINFIRSALYGNNEAVISETVPLPFDKLPELKPLSGIERSDVVNSRLLDLELSPDGFYNLYYVPTQRPSLLEEDIPIAESILLLQAIAAMRIEDDELVEAYMAGVKKYKQDIGEGDSLYYMYLSALLSVKAGDYEGAVQIYREIRKRVISIDINLMLASALWVSGGGAQPSDEVIGLYEDVLDLQADTNPAIANLGFMRLYQADWEAARKLLGEGFEKFPGSFHVVYNLSYLDILEGNLEQALDNLYALRASLPDSVPLALALANVLIADGEYNRAIEELDGIKERASSAEVYLVIARLYRERAQPLLVMAELNDGSKLFPDNDELKIELLIEYAKNGEIAKYNELKAAMSVDVLESDYRTLLAAAIVEDSETAEENFNKAERLALMSQEKEDVLVYWLRYLLENEQVEKAEGVFDRVRNNYGDNWPGTLGILRIWYEALGADDEKKKELRAEMALLDLLSLPPLSQTDVAYCYIQLDEPQQAIALLEPLWSIDAARALLVLKQAYQIVGDDEKIELADRRLEVLQRSIRRKTDDYRQAAKRVEESRLVAAQSGGGFSNDADAAVIAAGKGEFVKQLNDAVRSQNFETAIAIYGQLLRLPNPPYTPAIMHQNRGVLYMKNKQFSEAAKDLEKALTFDNISDKDRINIHYNYALALARTGDFKNSAKSIDSLLEIDMNNLRALVLYGQLLQKLKRYEDMITVYTHIIDISPGQINSYIELSRAYRITRKLEEAIAVLHAGLDVAPRQKSLHRALGEIYTLVGDTKKANEHINIIKSL